MGKVLKADGSVADAWVEIDLVTPQSELWVTFPLYFSAAALTFWDANAPSPQFVTFWDDGHVYDEEHLQILAGPLWSDYWASSAAAPIPDGYRTVEHHFTNGGPTQVYVDGALVIDTTDENDTDIRYLTCGLYIATLDPSVVTYTRSFKAGTTRGGDELFSDDFSSGDLSAWTSTSGDVSVVADPFLTTLAVSTAPGLNPSSFTEQKVIS